MVDFNLLKSAPTNDPTVGWRMQFQSLVYGLDFEDRESITLVIGPEQVQVENGRKEEVDVRFIAKAGAWEQFASEHPPVGAQSVASMIETDLLDVETADVLKYARHTMMLEKLFAQLRTKTDRSAGGTTAELGLEPAIGRYLNMELNGVVHRVYFEEAGQGIPLLCLHTAGADGRQYRALFNDPEITANFRVIAFDLPWHGKSSPPPGFQIQPYMLTTDLYVDTIMAFKKALGLENPVVMGCSIGGRAVLHLALRYGDQFKAAIGLQSATHAESHAETKLGLLGKNILYRPDMHGSETAAASVMQLMSPVSPEKEAWETLWHYMQGGPGVFQGDLYYYFINGDMRNGLTDGIDTAQCPLYLLTGEYDLSATPEMSRQLAEDVKATEFHVMDGVGHFPMSEDPEKFRSYLLPVLTSIQNQVEA